MFKSWYFARKADHPRKPASNAECYQDSSTI